VPVSRAFQQAMGVRKRHLNGHCSVTSAGRPRIQPSQFHQLVFSNLIRRFRCIHSVISWWCGETLTDNMHNPLSFPAVQELETIHHTLSRAMTTFIPA
jgi:hypothetical protein